MKEQVKEKIFEEIRRKNMGANERWTVIEYTAFKFGLNPKEQQVFCSIMDELVQEGIFEQTDQPPKSFKLTAKGVKVIY